MLLETYPQFYNEHKLVFSCYSHSQSQPRSSTLMVMEPIQDLGITLINREKIGGYM